MLSLFVTHTQTQWWFWESIIVVCGYILTVSFTNLTRSFQHNIDWHHSTLHSISIPRSTSPLEGNYSAKSTRSFTSSFSNSFILVVHVFRYSCPMIFICCDILGWAFLRMFSCIRWAYFGFCDLRLNHLQQRISLLRRLRSAYTNVSLKNRSDMCLSTSCWMFKISQGHHRPRCMPVCCFKRA